MAWIIATSWLFTVARAEYSDWCSDATTYHLKIEAHPLDVRVGDGGRVCADDTPPARWLVTRVSVTGGLTGVSSYYAFYDGRVRLNLRHLKFRCQGSHDCSPIRAGERCALTNASANAWAGTEGVFKELKPSQLSPQTTRLAFDRVAWNALLGVGPARELIADESTWANYGLDAPERAALHADLEFSRRHCAEIAAEPGGGLVPAGRLGAIEDDRLVPLGEYGEGHWRPSETTFRSLYKKLDAGAAEVWALRTAVPAPLETPWRELNDSKTPAALDLELPFLMTTDQIAARRGFFKSKTPLGPTPGGVRVVSTFDGVKDPEKWRALKAVPAALIKRGRELFRTEFPKRFECMPSVDEASLEVMRATAEPFADRDVEVFRAFVARTGDALVGVRARGRCRQAVTSETGLAPVLQRHWFFVPRTGAARLVTRAKDPRLAVDLDGDGRAEWIFTSAGVDPRPPYYYALFDRRGGEVIESH